MIRGPARSRRPALPAWSARRPARWAGWLVVLMSGAIAGAGPAHAQGGNPPAMRPPIQAHAAVRPAAAELGERVIYQGWVLHPGGRTFARWLPPDTSAALTWGDQAVHQGHYVPGSLNRRDERRRKADAAGRYELGGYGDTLFVEIPLQAFALGRLTIPGVPVEIDDGRGPRIVRLPVVTLDVMPVLTAADSNADYRSLHAPLAAPWWERVPWTLVVLGLLLLAVAWWAMRAVRRRAVAPTSAPEALPIDPRAEALSALAALRALSLPEHGRFVEHSFRLGQILRRYLEATTGVARPGDSSPELVAHLKNAGLGADDLTRLSALLRVWDQVKFAREPFTLDEAVRAERAVEGYLRRPAVVAEKVA